MNFQTFPAFLQVRGTTRHTPSADAVGTGLTTSRRAPALRADTPQPGSESVSLNLVQQCTWIWTLSVTYTPD